MCALQLLRIFQTLLLQAAFYIFVYIFVLDNFRDIESEIAALSLEANGGDVEDEELPQPTKKKVSWDEQFKVKNS